jgi:hypothetical protein
MASITKDPDGHKRILFVAPDGKRKSLWLGKAPQRIAEAVKTKVEALLAAMLTSSLLEDETTRWLNTIDTTMHNKLAAVGLVPNTQNHPHNEKGKRINGNHRS